MVAPGPQREPGTEAGRRLAGPSGPYRDRELLAMVLAIEAEAADDHEAELRRRGWLDEEEVQVALRMREVVDGLDVERLRGIARELLPLAYAWVDYRKGSDAADRFETRMLAALASDGEACPVCGSRRLEWTGKRVRCQDCTSEITHTEAGRRWLSLRALATEPPAGTEP